MKLYTIVSDKKNDQHICKSKRAVNEPTISHRKQIETVDHETIDICKKKIIALHNIRGNSQAL